MTDRLGRLLLVPRPVLGALRSWLNSWRGIADVVHGMARQGFDLQLTRYDARGRLAGDLLHERDGALDHERDRVGVGADAMARGPGRGAGRAEESGVNAMEATTASCASPHSIAESSRRANTKTAFHLLTDQPPSLPGPL